MSKIGQEFQRQPDSEVYCEAWMQLYNAFGERMQSEELKLMDSVLQSVRLDFKERQDAIQNKATE